MKKILYIVLPLVFAMLLAACGQKTDKTKVVFDTIPSTEISIAAEYYFSGEFSYMADAASLKNAATGTTIPVAMKEAYAEAEKQYLSLGNKDGSPAFAAFNGYLAPKPEGEEGPDQQLVITRVIEFDNTVGINPKKMLVGTYQTADQTLILTPTFGYTLKAKNGESEKGKWFLADQTTLIFLADKGNTVLTVDYNTMQLRTRDDNPITYKKQ